MLNVSCEVMGASWRGQPNRQDDAILIQDRILQHDHKITQCYQPTDALCKLAPLVCTTRSYSISDRYSG